MGKNKLKWLTLSQSSVFFASSLIFPFYILFVKNIGSSYTQFGFSYGLFGLSGALIYPLLGRLSERIDSRYYLLANSWGMAVLLLYVPHVNGVLQVYIVQVLLGLFGAMQKHGEKVLIADFTDTGERGKKIGNYHFWTAVFSAAAIMLGGFLADFFTVQMIFYTSSILYFLSGLMMKKTG
ncbi:MFS transporter [Bacillus mojavensis]|uniref:MFS transporter n=1 Tax=Bacillus mojavensis TaxID=72360 RepID=UPI002DBF962B|nr:MFS transporter [Bacillus mojavensis]MEC1689383.1 MFS transporter [Bacillus mojavensis]